MLIFILLFVNFLIASVISNVARNRQISPLSAFMISFFLSPIIGMFAVAMSPEIKQTEILTEEVIEPQEDNFMNFVSKHISTVLLCIVVLLILAQIIMY